MKTDIFQAIADPTRRAILGLLVAGAMTPGVLAENSDISRQAVSKHIKILKECSLLEKKNNGRETYYHLKPERLKEIDNWLEQFKAHWERRFDQLDDVLNKLNAKNDEK